MESKIRKIIAAILALFVFSGPAYCWNFKGHYVVCRRAWLQMTDQQRAKVTEILKKHPHYDAYLTKEKPEGITIDEWVFMWAGAWADWVRGGQGREYGHSEWHHINYPVCFPDCGSSSSRWGTFR